MADPRIFPTELQPGDVITSDPRRDYRVRTVALDDFGDVVINDGAPDRVRIDREQTVAITPRPTLDAAQALRMIRATAASSS